MVNPLAHPPALDYGSSPRARSCIYAALADAPLSNLQRRRARPAFRRLDRDHLEHMSDPGAFAVAGAEEQEGDEPPPLAGAGVVVCRMG